MFIIHTQAQVCASKIMAHFEQAALLATAWSNDNEVKTMALQHAIVHVSNHKKLKRSGVPSGTGCVLLLCV